MKALVIGKFQPFHLGHEDAVKQLMDRGFTQILFAVICPDERNSTYPLDFLQIKGMIDAMMQHTNIAWSVYHISESRSRNFARLVENAIPELDKETVIVNDNLFYIESFQAYQVMQTKRNIALNGKELRDRIKQDWTWEQFVPPPVAQYLQEHHLIKSIKLS